MRHLIQLIVITKCSVIDTEERPVVSLDIKGDVIVSM